MAVLLYPRNADRKIHLAVKRSDRTRTRQYVALSSLSDYEDDVRDAINLQTPATWGGLLRNDADVELVGGLNQNIWDVSVKYVHEENEDSEEEQEEGDGPQFSFDTSGGQTHITHYLVTPEAYWAEEGDPPDQDWAINVTSEGVQGVDINAPSLRFKVTSVLPSTLVTTKYVKMLSDMTGTTNNAKFNGFEAGEVLFAGAQGQQRTPRKNGTGDWECTFNFEAGKNKHLFFVGDILVDSKKAWQYLWVAYQEVEDTNNHIIVSKPLAVYVGDVYESSNFDDFEITD